MAFKGSKQDSGTYFWNLYFKCSGASASSWLLYLGLETENWKQIGFRSGWRWKQWQHFLIGLAVDIVRKLLLGKVEDNMFNTGINVL